MSSHPVGTAFDLIEEGYAMLATEPFDTQGHPELLTVQSRLEAVAWKQPAITCKLIARLAAEASPVELGGKNLADVLATRLRSSTSEARRRMKTAESLGPRTAITGEPLAPKLPTSPRLTPMAPRRGLLRRRPCPARPDHRQTRSRRDEQDQRTVGPRSTCHVGCGVREVGGSRDVQSGR